MTIFYLPDEGNEITQGDIDSGILRITVHAKPYFEESAKEVTIVINDVPQKVGYTHRIGRSDLLRTGKKAMKTLQLKEGIN